MWSVFNAGNNKNIFLKDGMRFYDEQPQFFSFFNEYDYPILNSVDEFKIELYLNHVQEVIANNDAIFYECIINWYLYISLVRLFNVFQLIKKIKEIIIV